MEEEEHSPNQNFEKRIVSRAQLGEGEYRRNVRGNWTLAISSVQMVVGPEKEECEILERTLDETIGQEKVHKESLLA